MTAKGKKRAGFLTGMAVLLLAQMALSPDLFSPARQFLIMIFMALGLSLEMFAGDLDFAFAAQISASTLLGAWLIGNGAALWAALAAMLAFHLVLGCVKGVLLSALRIPSIILTFALQMILGGMSAFFSGDSAILVHIPGSFYADKLFWGSVAVIFALLLCALHLLLERTWYGRYCRMMGENMEAVRESGAHCVFNQAVIHMAASVFFAVTAGVLLLVTKSGSAALGSRYLYTVIAAACLGGVDFQSGRGEIPGVILGTFAILLIMELLTISGQFRTWGTIVEGMVIIAAILLNNRNGQKN